MGITQGGKTNPSQGERIRCAVQQRGGNREQVKDIDSLVDESVAKIGRQTYLSGSKALHVGATREDVTRLVGWVLALLGEVLPEA